MPDEKVVDETQTVVDGADQSTSDTETKPDSTSEGKTDETGAEEKPEGVSQEQGTFISDLLVEYDLETPEQLKDFIGAMKDLEDKIGGEDLDNLLDNKALMEKYQKHWASQDAAKKKDGETPEETIKRLEGEITDKDAEAAKSKSKAKQSQEAQRALTNFNGTVTRTIKTIKEIPAEYHDFFGLFMGVDNPINDVDLTDKGSVIDLTKKGAKRLIEFEQAVIKRYLAGKAEVPDMTTTQDTATEKEPGKIKNLSDARNKLVEVMTSKLAAKKAKQ